MKLWLVVLASSLDCSTAWVNYFHTRSDDDIIYRWNAPQSFTEDDGLAGGLTWAAQDDFCDKLLPKFYAETQFNLVSCEAVLDSIVRGFATWCAAAGKAGRGCGLSLSNTSAGRPTTASSPSST